MPRAVRHRRPSGAFDGSAARFAMGGYDGRDEGEGARPSQRFSRRSLPRTAAENVMIRTCPSGRVEPRFLIEPFEPAYLATHRSGVLAERVAASLRELEDCCACPRNCHVNRLAGETRVC